MNDLNQQIVEALGQDDLAEKPDIIVQASELMQGAIGTNKDVRKLERAISGALEKYLDKKDPNVISSLIWALSKSGKPQYKKIYQRSLLQGFRRFLSYNQIVYQALLALSDCEEEIEVLDWEKDKFGGAHTTLGSSDHDKIAYLASKYLQAIEKDPYS